jgi:hypothetical protein
MPGMLQRAVVGKPDNLQSAVCPFQPRQPYLGLRSRLLVSALMPPHDMIRPVSPALLDRLQNASLPRQERLQMAVGVTQHQRVGPITAL